MANGPGGLPWPLSDERYALLRELRKPPIERRVPHPGDSVVFDRRYRELKDGGFIYWHRESENVSSFHDHYRLTARGKALLDDYAMMARGLAGTRRDRRRPRQRRRDPARGRRARFPIHATIHDVDRATVEWSDRSTTEGAPYNTHMRELLRRLLREYGPRAIDVTSRAYDEGFSLREMVS